MDILYFSTEVYYELTKYCSIALIIKVLSCFGNCAIIRNQDDGNKPSRWWTITNFIKDDSIMQREKLSVILSFAAIGGVVSIEDRMETGDVNVLNMLKDTKNVSDEDYNYFIDCFWNFSHNCGKVFSIQ